MIDKDKGFSLVTVIFLLVIIASIATFMVRVGSVQQQTSAYSVLTTRSQYAAESGLQWAIQSVIANGACFTSPTSFSLTGGASGNFNIRTTCTASTFTENPNTFNVYQLESRATQGNVGEVDFISLTVVASVTDAP